MFMKRNIVKFKRLIAYIVCMFVLMSVNAQEVTVNGLKYYLFPETHEAVLNHMNEWQGELTIPSEISYNANTYIVNGISIMAFTNCKELTKVRIPKTIDHVLHYLIGDGNGGFPTYYMNPFDGCSALEIIEVEEDNPIFKTVDGVLFNKDGTRLYCYPAGNKAETYVVPEPAVWIGEGAFGYNENLVAIELPTIVEKLYSGFSGCTRLESVNLPDNLAVMNNGMFYNCHSLRSIDIPSGVTNMGGNIFQNCYSLESILLPENISTIDDYAFYNCTSLKEIVLPSSLRVISGSLFANCCNLRAVTIQNGVTAVYDEAFKDCSSLKDLDLPASITYIGDDVFSGCKFDHLIIRGRLNYPSKYIFNGLDTSTPIYTIASQVEELKKIYEGEVLPLEAYIDGIEQIKRHQPSTHVFDLQGRRLSDKPSKGVYIQNGKKLVIK